MSYQQHPAYPFFSGLFSDGVEVTHKGSSTQISFTFSLGNQKVVWSSSQVGKDKWEVVCPAFCLISLGLEEDFTMGRMTGRALLETEDLESLSELDSESSDFKALFTLFSLFCSHVSEELGEEIQIDTTVKDNLAVASYVEIKRSARYSYDLTYEFGEETFKFTLSNELYTLAKELNFFKVIRSYFSEKLVYRAEAGEIGEDDLEAEISVRLFGQFFGHLDTFVKRAHANKDEVSVDYRDED